MSGTADNRFVVLHHTGVDQSHFDIMVETSPGSLLATWRSRNWPIVESTPLVKLRDHRRTYLDYEGLISGDRGAVYRVAEGYCDSVSNSVVRLADIVITLHDGDWSAERSVANDVEEK